MRFCASYDIFNDAFQYAMNLKYGLFRFKFNQSVKRVLKFLVIKKYQNELLSVWKKIGSV